MTKVSHLLTTSGLMLASLAFVPGCASDTWPDDIPRTAVLNTESTGRVTYTAPTSGTVYVYDETDERLLYSGNVLAGQRVVLDPREDRIDVDGQKVSDHDLGAESHYQVYFDSSGGARTVEHRVIERRVDAPVVTEERRIIVDPDPAVTTEQRTTVKERVVVPAPPVTEQRTTVEERRVEQRIE